MHVLKRGALSSKNALYEKESATTMTSLATRATRLQTERDALDVKYKVALKGHELLSIFTRSRTQITERIH